MQQRSTPLSKNLSIASTTRTAPHNMKSSSVILVGQVCDDKCTVVLNSEYTKCC